MHFFGVFMQVHFEAKNKGLRGLTPGGAARPARRRCAANWPTLIPLRAADRHHRQRATRRISPRSPASRRASWSACSRRGSARRRCSTSRCSVSHARAARAHHPAVRRATASGCSSRCWSSVPLVHRALGREVAHRRRGDPRRRSRLGAKYALAVGAAAATVGIVIGVVTLTGVGFKLSYIVTVAPRRRSRRRCWRVLPTGWADMQDADAARRAGHDRRSCAS